MAILEPGDAWAGHPLRHAGEAGGASAGVGLALGALHQGGGSCRGNRDKTSHHGLQVGSVLVAVVRLAV